MPTFFHLRRPMPSPKPNGMRDYEQTNIYLQNFIRARNYNFSEAYSELIGRLCAVESVLSMRESPEGLSTELMATFKGVSLYDKIDRICLAMRVGLSNELVVCDSGNSPRAAKNIMSRGYRCFVSPNSSLFDLREGEIRIYDDATRIAETFHERRRPVQRSLRYLIEMGFESGVCVPLHVAGNLRGFFFFNSVDLGLFTRLEDEDYAILNLLAMIGKIGLIGEVTGDDKYRGLAGQPFAHFTGALFDEEQFQNQLHEIALWKTGEFWQPRIGSTGNIRFLYSPASTAFLAFQVCKEFYGSVSKFPASITIESLDQESVLVRIPIADDCITSLDKYRDQVARLSERFGFIRASLMAGINDVAIRLPFDAVTDQRESELYSV